MIAVEDRLAEIEALADAATKGPWVNEPNTMAGRVWVERSRTHHIGLPVRDCEPLFNVRGEDAYEQRARDAAFIAASRADVPALTAALRAVLALHKPGEGHSQGFTATGYGYIEPFCAGCEAWDEYAVEWPCDTVCAIAAALVVTP